MLKTEFFGIESVIHEKVIFYNNERSGNYIFESTQLANVIRDYQVSNNYPALEQALKEIFWICNKGRRPWSLEAEKSFLALASVGYDLMAYLHTAGKISNDTYAFIDPLSISLHLEYEVEHIENMGVQFNGNNFDMILAIFHQLTHIYILLFDCWVSDFPQMVKLPEITSMNYLLESGSDIDFSILIKAFAKTKRTIVKQILVDFTDDDEESVKFLARNLLKMYF